MEMIHKTFGKVTVDMALQEGDRACYIILPFHPKEKDLGWLEGQSGLLGCSLAILAGVSWDHDMTPWEAPDIGKSTRTLKGRGGAFLDRLLGEILPEVEKTYFGLDIRRYLVGVSLSGLFALWAGARTDAFCRIGSVSGSLWYDDFTLWLQGAEYPGVERFYLSLGDREKFTLDSRVATVEDRTLESVSILRSKGKEVLFEMNPGTHYEGMYPRLEKALVALISKV